MSQYQIELWCFYVPATQNRMGVMEFRVSVPRDVSLSVELLRD